MRVVSVNVGLPLDVSWRGKRVTTGIFKTAVEGPVELRRHNLDGVHIGDEFRVGDARVVVTEPRMPCFKLGIRFDRADMVKRFMRSQRTGFYLGVVEEGRVQAGDELERLSKHPDGLPVADVTRLYTTERANTALLRKAMSVSALPESWRSHFEHQLEKLQL